MDLNLFLLTLDLLQVDFVILVALRNLAGRGGDVQDIAPGLNLLVLVFVRCIVYCLRLVALLLPPLGFCFR